MHVHSHDPDPEKLSVVKARAGMKRAAKDTAEKTQNIIALNVEGGLNHEDTLARLPNGFFNLFMISNSTYNKDSKTIIQQNPEWK